MQNSKTRPEMKAAAKKILRVNFTAKMLLFVIPILASIFSIASSFRNNPNYPDGYAVNLTSQNLLPLLGLLVSLLIQVIAVGGLFRYIQIYRGEVENPKFTDAFIPFGQGHFGKIILLVLVEYLVPLLLAITIIGLPFAIYLALGWSQAEKILFDQIQEGSYRGLGNVLSSSSQIMRGRRGNYFVFLLSFIGWALLDALTLGIAGFWVTPYLQMSDVAYYQNILDEEKAQDFQA